MDRLTAAQVFLDIARTGSFTKTAEHLHMSRSMVTRHIETLENWLNTRLLHRTTRKVSLTSAGERCLPEIEQWLKHSQMIVSQTQQAGELSGLIRVASSLSFGYTQVVPVIVEFMNQHPKVQIDLELHDEKIDLIERQVDLAIRISSVPEPSLIGKPIATCDSVLVAAPDYFERHPPILQPKDLSEHICLGYKRFDRNVWHFRQWNQYESVDVSCALTVNEATALLKAVQLGSGIGILPTFLVKPLIQKRKLVTILPEWEVNPMKIYVLYHSRKHLSPAVRVLIDALADAFSEQSW